MPCCSRREGVSLMNVLLLTLYTYPKANEVTGQKPWIIFLYSFGPFSLNQLSESLVELISRDLPQQQQH